MTFRVRTSLVVVVTIAMAGCDRTTTTERSAADPTADRRSEDAAELEGRLNALEREWNQVRDRIADQTADATAEARTRIQDDFAVLRQELDELRTTTAQNWWERQERQIERVTERMERHLQRLAPNWKSAGKAATSDSTRSWSERRDELVSRIQSSVREMEQALEPLDPRDKTSLETEDTRSRLQLMKEDVERLRTASEDQWWEITKARIAASLDRLDAAIDRLAKGQV